MAARTAAGHIQQCQPRPSGILNNSRTQNRERQRRDVPDHLRGDEKPKAVRNAILFSPKPHLNGGALRRVGPNVLLEQIGALRGQAIDAEEPALPGCESPSHLTPNESKNTYSKHKNKDK